MFEAGDKSWKEEKEKLEKEKLNLQLDNMELTLLKVQLTRENSKLKYDLQEAQRKIEEHESKIDTFTFELKKLTDNLTRNKSRKRKLTDEGDDSDETVYSDDLPPAFPWEEHEKAVAVILDSGEGKRKKCGAAVFLPSSSSVVHDDDFVDKSKTKKRKK